MALEEPPAKTVMFRKLLDRFGLSTLDQSVRTILDLVESGCPIQMAEGVESDYSMLVGKKMFVRVVCQKRRIRCQFSRKCREKQIFVNLSTLSERENAQ